MNAKWIRGLGATAAVAATCLAATQLAQARPADAPPAAATVTSQSCSLGANGSPIKHVIYIQFDNTHYRRGRPERRRRTSSRCPTCCTSSRATARSSRTTTRS